MPMVIDTAAAWDALLQWRRDGGPAQHVDGPPMTAAAEQLFSLYRPLLDGPGRQAVAQMAQSLDGYIATSVGDSCFVTGEEDRTHLHRLRALCDAVLVGAGTAVTDDPRLTVRHVPGPNPTRVVIDPRARVPADAGVFTDARAPTLWLVGESARPIDPGPGVEMIALPLDGAGTFAPALILDVLAARGLQRVLVEGGGITVSRFLTAGTLSRLYLTVAPLVIGSGRRGVDLPACPRLRDALRPPVRRFMLGQDTLFELELPGDDPAPEARGWGQASTSAAGRLHSNTSRP